MSAIPDSVSSDDTLGESIPWERKLPLRSVQQCSCSLYVSCIAQTGSVTYAVPVDDFVANGSRHWSRRYGALCSPRRLLFFHLTSRLSQFMASGRSSQELFKLKTPITLGLTSTVACDLLITAAMIVIVSPFASDRLRVAHTDVFASLAGDIQRENQFYAHQKHSQYPYNRHGREWDDHNHRRYRQSDRLLPQNTGHDKHCRVRPKFSRTK